MLENSPPKMAASGRPLVALDNTAISSDTIDIHLDTLLEE